MSVKGLDCNAWRRKHPDVQTLRDAAGFLACGLLVAVIAWMALAPQQVRGWLIDTLAPIGALVMAVADGFGGGA